MNQKASKLLLNTTNTFRELFTIYIVIILIASMFYAFFEHKTLFDAFWWAVVTAMTIGYGDNFPITFGGRIDAILLMHIVPLFVIPLITARLSSKLIVNSDVFSDTEQEEIKKGIRDIKKHLKIK
jgi:voltage-gated potassium channel